MLPWFYKLNMYCEVVLKMPPGCRNQTKNIDMTEILRDIYEAERAQNRANDDLEEASNHVDQIRNTVQLVTTHIHKPIIRCQLIVDVWRRVFFCPVSAQRQTGPERGEVDGSPT